MHTPLHFFKKLIKSIICNPNAYENDLFISQNKRIIKIAVSLLMELKPLKNEKVFRGVLLEKSEKVITLKPQKSRQYNSFSTCKKVAFNFADPNDPLSIPLVLMGKRYGYILEDELFNFDLIFHHSWGDFLGIYKGIMKDFKYQKEVILFQNDKSLIYKRA